MSQHQQVSDLHLRDKLLNVCLQYIFNSLPTHLIRISPPTGMTIVSRTHLWSEEQNQINGIDKKNLIEQRNASGSSSTDDHWCEKYVKDRFRFAIFSHRWGVGEPLFLEMPPKSLSPLSSPGYDKLCQLCKKAWDDFGCPYVWSDTCCINKESSSELGEAIRSMYRWYNTADVCIVHLGQSSTVDDLDQDPWFRRVWTLQELLAPKKIRFYGQDWKPIWPQADKDVNDKENKELVSVIGKVTQIPEDHLKGFRPSRELVSEIMTWSARRQTTRIEDTAYSLLGLLDISIPIAYGEGPRAFHRLMLALANECHTAHFFAWAGTPSAYSRALPASPKCFARVNCQETARSQPREMAYYEATKHGVVVKLLLFMADQVTRQFTITYTDAERNNEESVVTNDNYAVGIVSLGYPGPDGKVSLGDGRKYIGIRMKPIGDQTQQRWEKVEPVIVEVSHSESITQDVMRVCLLHTTETHQ